MGRGGKQHSLTDRRPPSSPIAALSPRSLECPSTWPGHSPRASSFFPAAGDKKKTDTEQGRCSPFPSPSPSCQVVCPLPSVVRGQGRLLAGYSLVEVDVAQVLGRLLRGTHFLVIVDHPSGEGGER